MADILSLKGLFLCLRIVTYLLMGKTTSAQMGHYLLRQPTLPTFPKFSFLEENHYITLQIFRGMAWKQYGRSKTLSDPILFPSLFPGDFPGGLVIKIPCFHCRGPGFDPWSGNKVPHATQHGKIKKKKKKNRSISFWSYQSHSIPM